MSTRTALRHYIYAHPEDKLAPKVLADEMQERYDMSRFAALRYACKVRRARINAREITQAMKLIDDTSPVREDLMNAVLYHVAYTFAPIGKLVIVSGSRPPSAVTLDELRDGGIWRMWKYTVGARWLIRTAEEIQIEALKWESVPDHPEPVE